MKRSGGPLFVKNGVLKLTNINQYFYTLLERAEIALFCELYLKKIGAGNPEILPFKVWMAFTANGNVLLRHLFCKNWRFVICRIKSTFLHIIGKRRNSSLLWFLFGKD